MNDDLVRELLQRLEQIERRLDEVRQLVGPFGVSFPNNEILIQTLFGTKYFVDANDLVMAPQLVVYRQWESDLSAFFIKSVSPDTTFLDIGANFGYFTCLVASQIGTTGRGQVIAVEPNPRMHDLLMRNIRVNWSMAPIETHACAITLDGVSIDMIIPADGAANASILADSRLNTGGSNKIVHVRGNTVDRILNGRTVDLVKIDVEGFELHVLEGATETFRAASHLHVVMEWAISQMAQANIDPAAVIDKVESLGLAAYRLPESIHVGQEELDRLRYSRDDLLATDYANIYLRNTIYT